MLLAPPKMDLPLRVLLLQALHERKIVCINKRNKAFENLERTLRDLEEQIENARNRNSRRKQDNKDKHEKQSNDDDDGDKREKGGGRGGDDDNNDSPKRRDGDPNPRNLVLAGVAAAALLAFLTLGDQHAGVPESTFQDFKMTFLASGKVDHIEVINHHTAYIYVKGNSRPVAYFIIGSVDSFERQLEDAQLDLGVKPRDFITLKYAERAGMNDLMHFLPTLLLIGASLYMGNRMLRSMGDATGGGGKRGIFSMGKSGATVVMPGDRKGVTFKDVAGLDEAKVEVMEFVEFLKRPKHFTKLGAKIPKGALLVGPPGTGKTLLAKATAGEASVPFFSISGSDFLEMFVGVGPARVRDLFAEARKHAPCIIFIDEIDAVARARGSGRAGGNDERENTLNQMLVEMDGFNTTEGVVVLAGTNRVDILDKALLRPGRFDRQITIDKPDIRGREQIFHVHLKKIKIAAAHTQEQIAQRLAALTPGFAGADIANICNEAALIAARHSKDFVDLEDFERAIDRVIGGLEKKYSVMTKAEKELIAHHEAGHAVAGWFLEHADPLLKVTIVARGNGALGFAQYLPKEVALYNQKQLTDKMCMALGGRAAEQIFFGDVSTGASDDLKKVTALAHGQVTAFGMSPRLPNVSYELDPNSFHKTYSETTAQIIDEEISKLVEAAYQRTVALLTEKKALVKALADKLIELETINHDVIVSVLGPRPFMTDAYKEYMKHSHEVLRKQQEAEELARKERLAHDKEHGESTATGASPAAAESSTSASSTTPPPP